MKTLISNLLGRFGFQIVRKKYSCNTFEGTLRLLEEFLQVKTVIDVGVAQGTPELYTIFRPQEYDYVLIEPNPAFTDHLDVLQSELNAQIERVFCSDSNGTTDFYLYEDPRKSSKHQHNRALDIVGKIETSTSTLDAIIEKYGCKPNILLKVDVEGSEYDVLRGAEDSFHKIEAIIVEANLGRKFADVDNIDLVFALLSDNGFVLFDVFSPVRDDKGVLYQCDLVFVQKEAACRSISRR